MQHVDISKPMLNIDICIDNHNYKLAGYNCKIISGCFINLHYTSP